MGCDVYRCIVVCAKNIFKILKTRLRKEREEQFHDERVDYNGLQKIQGHIFVYNMTELIFDFIYLYLEVMFKKPIGKRVIENVYHNVKRITIVREEQIVDFIHFINEKGDKEL